LSQIGSNWERIERGASSSVAVATKVAATGKELKER